MTNMTNDKLSVGAVARVTSVVHGLVSAAAVVFILLGLEKLVPGWLSVIAKFGSH